MEQEEKTYRCITWATDADLGRQLGKDKKYIYYYKKKGFTYEQIIDFVLDGKKYKTYREITWSSTRELSTALSISRATISNYKKKGFTYEQIIDFVLNGIIVKVEKKEKRSYRSITWTSNSDLSKQLKKSDGYVSRNIRQGKTYEEIIDYVLDNNAIAIPRKKKKRSYRDITWYTNADLSRQLGREKGYVSDAIRRGKTYKEIIDENLDGNCLSVNTSIKSYRNIVWTTDVSLSELLKKNSAYIAYFLKKGKTREEIIDNLLIKKALSIGKFNELSIIKPIKRYSIYYSVIFNGKEDVWSNTEILDYIGDVSILLPN